MDSWREMDNGNIELYYAIINILDWYGKEERKLYTDIDMIEILSLLGNMGGFTPEEIGDANDCGECHSWIALANSFRELWKNKERM